MPQHSYKQLEEVYQRGVNKEHKINPARTHPMSSRQGKGCLEMPINQTEPAQYSQDSQSDSDHEFDVTTVNPNVECTRLDGAHSRPYHRTCNNHSSYHRTCNNHSSPEKPQSDPSFHCSRITDDRRHIGYRLPERIQNIL